MKMKAAKINKQGISLIVLVITIIVMIVLAGAIILSLNNAGIIGKANEAVRDTDEATVKELAQMAWAEAYANKVRDVEGDNGLRAKVEEALQANGVDTTETSKYLINVTEKGVTIKLKINAWIQDGLKVVRGEDKLEIGQTVSFDERVESYTGGWKVLGADADGNLLIMSDKDVATVKLGGTTMDEAHESWKTGASDITKAVQEAIPIAGKTNVISVRSIEVEDIDKVTGYDPTTYGDSAVPHQYGNIVTYTYNGTTKPTYTGTNGTTGDLAKDHSEKGFYWSDGKDLQHVKTSDLTNAENNGKEIAKITSNYYSYEGTAGANKLTEGSIAYKMIFRNSNDTANAGYWLASPCVNAGANYVYFGMCCVYSGNVIGDGLFGSHGNVASSSTRSVRAVVTLSSDTLASDLT